MEVRIGRGFGILFLAGVLSACGGDGTSQNPSYTIGNANPTDTLSGTSYPDGSYVAMQVEVTRTTTLESLAVYVIGSSSGSQIRMAVHTSNGTFPQALVVGSEIQTLTTGEMTFDVTDTVLSPGNYFVGYQSDAVVNVADMGGDAVAKVGADGTSTLVTDPWSDSPHDAGGTTTGFDIGVYMTVRD
jgi:hypothetical protein